MKEKPFSLDKYLRSLQFQDALSLGYLFLLILGIINNVIYWKGLNINIFDYTSLTDILMTPLNTLFLNMKGTALILIFLFIMVKLIQCSYPFLTKRGRALAEKNNKPYKEVPFEPMPFAIVMFVCIFFGYNQGISLTMKSLVKSKTHTPNQTITFMDNTKKDVFVVGLNSLYVFYADPGSDQVTIAPINGNVKSMIKLPKANK